MSSLASSFFNQIADDLAERGFAEIDGFLSNAEVDAILQADEFKNSKLHFKKAGIGNNGKQINEGIRGDYIQWIDPKNASSAESTYLSRLEELIRFLNESLFLSLKGVEAHRTIYPIGAKYQRHLDQFRTDDHRKLSLICYLNSNWTIAEGGQLRLHLSEGTHDILPVSGRLICFRSDMIEHEVLPATRERYSLTGWAVDRDPDMS
jgi:SM-20-related protein